LLEWLRRKKDDDKTICKLFYICCDDIQDMELTTALRQLLDNWFVSQPAFIQALCPDFGWEV